MIEQEMVPGKFVVVTPGSLPEQERAIMWFARRIQNFVGIKVGYLTRCAEFICPEDRDKLEKARKFIGILQGQDPGMQVRVQDRSCFPPRGC